MHIEETGDVHTRSVTVTVAIPARIVRTGKQGVFAILLTKTGGRQMQGPLIKLIKMAYAARRAVETTSTNPKKLAQEAPLT